MEFQEFIRTYNEIVKAYNKIYHDFAVELGLSDSALVILYELRIDNKDITQKDLGELLSLSKQTVNSSIKVLSDKGLVDLQESKYDKRIKSVVLTERGKQFCVEKIDKIINVERHAFERLSDMEGEALLSMEKKYYKLMYEESLKVIGKINE